MAHVSADLPTGYRWATFDETDAHLNIAPIPGAQWIDRTVDRHGHPYPEGTCDLAVPA